MQTEAINKLAETNNQKELQAAFHLFSQMSGQLEQSYRELEQRVEQLTRELATARTEKLKQLAEKEKLADRLNTLHQAMPAAVIWIDKNHNVLSVNQAAKEIFKTNIIDKNWSSVLATNFSFDGHELHAKNSMVFSFHQQSLEQEQGQVIILTDVTRTRQLQQSNYRQQRLAELGEITAGIAHQVRTPLASALLSLDHLSHPSISAELQKKAIQRIKQNLLHLDKFVNDMLLYAKDGEFDNNCISVSLLLHNLDVYVEHKKYSNFSFRIENTLQSEDIILSGSGDALLSVLISLVENASQLATESVPVSVMLKIESDHNRCIFRVIDNGPGLTAKQAEQVFKPFYTTRKNGTGLGLAISKSIINAHQGQLQVISEKGIGTEMRVTLKKYNADKILASNTKQHTQEHRQEHQSEGLSNG